MKRIIKIQYTVNIVRTCCAQDVCVFLKLICQNYPSQCDDFKRWGPGKIIRLLEQNPYEKELMSY